MCLILKSADVKMPSGNVDKPVIDDNRDGTVSIRYDPREEGLHELTLKYNIMENMFRVTLKILLFYKKFCK